MGRALSPRPSPLVSPALVGAALLLAGCKTKDVHDAEAHGDVAFLESNEAPESTAALGRLADTSPRALAALEGRAKRADVNAFIAAWQGETRGASWSGAIFHEGLADPARAVVAQSALPRKDARVAALLPDLEAAFAKLPPSDAARVGALVVSLGAPAKPAVVRALERDSTRAAMCGALASPDASAEALDAFRKVPKEKRDDAACATLAAGRAESDDTMAAWLGADAEAGLLASASRRGTLSCPRAAIVWEKALLGRSHEDHAPLSSELAATTARCAEAMDPVLAKAIALTDEPRTWVVAAIDPQDRVLERLPLLCNGAKAAANGGPGTSVRTRERARDMVARGCAKTLAAR